jgi:hypothetical protein
MKNPPEKKQFEKLCEVVTSNLGLLYEHSTFRAEFKAKFGRDLNAELLCALDEFVHFDPSLVNRATIIAQFCVQIFDKRTTFVIALWFFFARRVVCAAFVRS